MKILPTPSLNVLITKVVKIVETTALERTNQRHALHYILKILGDLPTPLIERFNHHLKAPTAEQYPHTDAHMRLIIGLNHKLKPPIQITQLIQLRQKFATEMVALQSPSVWRQIDANDNSKNKNISHKENGNVVSWQDKVIANADGGDMIIRCYQSASTTTQNPEKNCDNVESYRINRG